MLTNGHEFSFTSCKTSLGSFGTGDALKSISYSHSLEGGEVEGNSTQLIGGTRGKYRAEASIEFATLRDYQAWIDSIGNGYMEKYFTITHTYAEAGVSPTLTDKITRCRIAKEAVDGSGTDGIGVKVDLKVFGIIVKNGKLPFLGAKE